MNAGQAENCVLLPGGPGSIKARLVEAIGKSLGQAPPYIASQEDMHICMLVDTAIVMYVKKYVVRANPDQVDRQDQTEVFLMSDRTWKLKLRECRLDRVRCDTGLRPQPVLAEV